MMEELVTGVARSQLYIVELRTRGWAVGISHTPEERVLTTIYRLSKREKNRLQALKVRFYRVLAKHAVFTLGEKYVVPQKRLPDVEAEFKKVYEEFASMRKEMYDELVSKWDDIEGRLKSYAVKMGLNVKSVERLKPSSESFLDMYYTVTPLSLTINQLVDLSEEFEKLAKERDEYRSLAERLKREAEKMLGEVKAKYEEKIAELSKVISELREALKEQSKEVYRLKLKAKEIVDDAREIASFLGEETVEDLKTRLEALKEYFAT